MPRSIINSIEAALFAASLFHELEEEFWKSRFFVGVGFVLRPTSIIPWVFWWPYRWISQQKLELRYFLGCVITVFLMVTVSVLLDTLYFGKLTSTALNFLMFNFIEGDSQLYGVHDPLWYLTQGIPLVLAGWIVFFGAGVYYYSSFLKTQVPGKAKSTNLLLALIFPLLILSLSKHKEDRFLLPYFSVFFLVAGIGLHQLNYRKPKLTRYLLSLAIISNLALFIFSTFLHNQASIPSLKYLGELVHENSSLNNVAILTECHQTPYYSFIHSNITLSFPECAP